MKRLSELITNIEILEIRGKNDPEIHLLCYDSRKSDPGALFAAIRGGAADGHAFIPAAVKRGATAILCEEINDELTEDSDLTFIRVVKTRQALAAVSHAYYDDPSRSLKIFGVTGTNGKTTTTFFLDAIFREAGMKTGLIGTTGILIDGVMMPSTHTTPESLELCKLFSEMKHKDIDAVSMEISSHALHQHRADFINFNGAIFTNLTHDHLDYHKDFDEYSAAKKRLFEMMPENSSIVANAENEYTDYMLKGCKSQRIGLFGRTAKAAYRICDEKISLNGIGFRLVNEESGLDLHLELPMIGRFNIENAASAATLALMEGFGQDVITAAFAKATGAPGRMEPIKLRSGALALVDYAHTPDALEKALQACRDVIDGAGGGRIICVFGCGGDRDKTKRPVMGKIASVNADYVILTSDNPRTEKPENIINDIYEGIERSEKKNTVMIGKRDEAIKYAAEFAGEGDLILVAGKGHEKYQIVGTAKIHFDDTEQLAGYL